MAEVGLDIPTIPLGTERNSDTGLGTRLQNPTSTLKQNVSGIKFMRKCKVPADLVSSEEAYRELFGALKLSFTDRQVRGYTENDYSGAQFVKNKKKKVSLAMKYDLARKMKVEASPKMSLVIKCWCQICCLCLQTVQETYPKSKASKSMCGQYQCIMQTTDIGY
ncbi:hypothetical protein CHS0354_031483 [Potamilus streckersoni]|uniref:Uncharacterized protein n=1 Tax=Potamilus streckersoni TaxID=2493646 RepID=A0AAE0VWT8_9BIVA|nr:hypothetical protein CHS0354_031483 [Potamilus streckersoni]